MKAFRILAVSAALLAFLLVVLGSWVRINGAGMTCPDWPLCKGSLVPVLEGGVVLEWSHRLVAAIEGVVLLGAVISGCIMRKQVGGVTPVLAALGVIFAIQVALGGLTVKLANRPDSVVIHWATAMALLAALSALAVLAVVGPLRPPRIDRRAGVLTVTAVAAFGAMCAGAYVSSSGAGLACAQFPGCGSGFFGHDLLQHAQMLHRGLAVLFALCALVALPQAVGGARRTMIVVALGCTLIVGQILLGIANVTAYLPTTLREAHAANAALTFVVFVIAAVLAAIDATPALSDVAPAYRRTEPPAGSATRRLRGV